MLQRFLFVGVGGSGGDTLRHLHRDLRRRLQRAGINDPELPSGWKFVHIDAPKKPENRAGLDDLPSGSYLPLVSRDVGYRIIAQQHERRGAEFWDECVGWLPPAGDVHVSIQEGAGQFRAIGRALAISRLAELRRGLAKAVADLELTAATDSLSEVEQRMIGRRPTDPPRAPAVVVISSLAGGTGSGVFLDVCDVLRSLDPSWAAESTAVLYAPDVFRSLDQDKRNGVHANALAAVSELLAGYWRQDAGADPVFEQQGLNVNDSATRRGPGRAFIVGVSNGRLTFRNQGDVFAAVGRTMGAWATSPVIQQEFLSYVRTNWDASITGTDPLGLVEGSAPPFSALGYASVDLGRDLFGQYAGQCLARLAAERLLYGAAGAEAATDPAGIKRSTAIERRLGELKRALGLERRDERPVAGMLAELAPPADDILRIERQAVAAAVGLADQPAQAWQQILAQVIGERREPFRTGHLGRLHENATAWVRTVQDRILAEVRRSLQLNGLPVTEGVVRALYGDLSGQIHPELVQHAGRLGQQSRTYQDEIRSTFSPESRRWFRQARLHPAGSQLVQHALERGMDAGYTRMMDADTFRIAALLLKDLAERFLRPMQVELRSALELLRRESTVDSSDRSGPIALWPQGPTFTPPLTLRPGPTQYLVDPIAQFPGVFLAKLAASTSKAQGDAQRHAITEIFAAQDVGTGHSPVPIMEQRRTWQPEVAREWGTDQDVEQSAVFALHTSAAELLQLATTWAYDQDRALGAYIRQPLGDALGGTRPDPEQQQRLDRFRTCLADAIAASAPLVDLDGAYAQAQRDGQDNAPPMITPIPLSPDTPAYQATLHLLIENAGLDHDQAADKFHPSGRDEIEFTTFLDRPSLPSEFASLTRPIRSDWAAKRHRLVTRRSFGQWRRARPLPDAVPLPSSVRRDLVCGWFVAYLNDQIKVEDAERVSLYDPDSGDWSAFPMLGERPDQGDPFDLLGAVVESVPLVLIEPLEDNVGARAYRQLIALGKVDPTTFTPDENFDRDVRDLLEKAEQSYGTTRRGTRVTRGWELRADIHWALGELHTRFGGR